MTWTPVDGIHFALMAKEFPEFDQSTLPTIPTDWIDNSWHNDVSPSFVIEAARVQVFISETNESEREIAGGFRFNVLSIDDATLDHNFLSTNDWDAVLQCVARLTETVPTVQSVYYYYQQMLDIEPTDETLLNLPIDSPCGQDCKAVIDAAQPLLGYAARASSDCVTDVLNAVDRIVSIYWRG